MLRAFPAELRARRHALKSAWERRLRSEPTTSPLANPDTLVLMMDQTLDELFTALDTLAESEGAPRCARNSRRGCLCGLNPLLAYYRVAASTLCAQVRPAEFRGAGLSPAEVEDCLEEALGVLQGIAQREITAFCAMCQMEIAQGRRAHAGGTRQAAPGGLPTLV